MNWREQLDQIYKDPNDPGSLGGLTRLYTRGKELNPKLTISKTKEYLRTQNAYTLHKPHRKKFSRNKTIVGSIDKQW